MPRDFDLNLARQGHPLVTRDGRKVLAFAYYAGNIMHPIAAIIDGCFGWWTFTKEGHNSAERPNEPHNLMLADLPEVEETWYANLYTDKNGAASGLLFSSPGEAMACSAKWFREVAVPVTIRRAGTWQPKGEQK